MENGKQETENKTRRPPREGFSESPFLLFDSAGQNICSACGAAAIRNAAKFCRVCGKSLSEGYQPLDRWRASYNLSRKKNFDEKQNIEKIVNLFEINKNFASESAKALVVYALVPYLGILFCPLAVVSGGIGIFVASRQPAPGGSRAAFYSTVAAFIIFAVQIFLWWLLYAVPELGKSV